ncbi:MAG: hypothetical protein GF375_05980 [Candidatus Omnitrophica bacterium]|nr:hypothetical protein [Candidatus Omnitrophota bacterium]MBD3269524.1 hypothetical protein [Candidatus Omnitrophota bacterium]
MKNMLKIFLVIILFLSCSYAFSESYKDAISYTVKTGKLWGISDCIISGDGSLTLIDAKDKGYGHVLWIPDGKGGYLEKVKLSPGESFKLTDGHHVFITYQFKKFSQGQINMEVTEIIDERSFGGRIKKKRKPVVIAPYGSKQ